MLFPNRFPLDIEEEPPKDVFFLEDSICTLSYTKQRFCKNLESNSHEGYVE
ncbi:hypothetical protein PGB90_003289 [Kerria lacca]